MDSSTVPLPGSALLLASPRPGQGRCLPAWQLDVLPLLRSVAKRRLRVSRNCVRQLWREDLPLVQRLSASLPEGCRSVPGYPGMESCQRPVVPELSLPGRQSLHLMRA